MVTTFKAIKNNVASVLQAGIDSSQLTIPLSPGTGDTFPAPPFYVSCEFEVMLCTAKTSNQLTVTRGVDGTTAATHPVDTIIEQRNNAALWTDIQTALTKIEDGTTVIPPNVPDGSISNVKLASDVARPNLLQNGGFEVWRGTGPFTANGIAFADPWEFYADGTDTFSVTRDSTNKEIGTYCAAVTFSKGSGTVSRIYNNMYQSNLGIIRGVAGKQYTITARIKTNIANAVRVSLMAHNSGTDNYYYSSYHSGSNTYETLTVTCPVISSTGLVVFQADINFGATCVAYIDSVTVVEGTISSNYSPALTVPDVISNTRLGIDVARSNLLTNGGFEIWQRGAGPFSVSGAYFADRWFISGSGGTISISNSATVDSTSKLSANVSFSKGASGYVLQQDVFKSGEGSDSVRGTTVAFSARVAPNTVGVVRVSIYDNVNSWRIGALNTGIGTWETISVIAPIPPGASQVSVGIEISASCQFYLDNAILVIGAVPSAYIPLHPTDDLARCQRYYHKLGGSAGALGHYGSVGAASDLLGAPIVLPTTMAVTPTVTKVGTWAVYNSAQPTCSAVTPDQFVISGNSSTNGKIYFYATDANAYITAEANP